MRLNHLTDHTLHKDLLALAQQEREILAKVLWHFKEVRRRKLYADYQCGSLFEYAVKILKYSEGQASRRVSACKLLQELPEIAPQIESGEINLTQLGQVKGFFTDENILDPKTKMKVIGKVKGKTTRETEKILWEMRSEEAPRRVTLVLKEETVQKLNQVRALKGHSCPDMDSLLMTMSATVMDLWNPIRGSRNMQPTEGSSRYVPVQVKSQVWERDKSKCRNCGSTFALELDHIKPFAAGGKTTVENLRLLCRNCNQRKGLEFFNKGAKSFSS